MAYSLLGLFRINMPLLYGEGIHAFQRLQEAIMKEIDDYSLFIWQDQDTQEPNSSKVPSFVSLLATSPASFSAFKVATSDRWRYADLEPIRKGTLAMEFPWLSSLIPDDPEDFDEPPLLTSRGVRLSLPALSTEGGRVLLAFLWCLRVGSAELVCVALTQSPSLKTVYARQRNGIRFVSLDNLADAASTFKKATFYVQCNHTELQIWQPNFGAPIHPPNWSAAVFLTIPNRREVTQVQFSTYPCTPVVFELEIKCLKFFLGFGVHSDLTAWSTGWLKEPNINNMASVLNLLSRNFEIHAPKVVSPKDDELMIKLGFGEYSEWIRAAARPKSWFGQSKNQIWNSLSHEILQRDRLYTLEILVECKVLETFERSRLEQLKEQTNSFRMLNLLD